MKDKEIIICPTCKKTKVVKFNINEEYELCDTCKRPMISKQLYDINMQVILRK